MSDTRVKDVRGFYMALFSKLFGFSPTINFPMSGAVIKKWLKDLNEWQINTLIIIHFNWRGMDGNDEYIYKRLRDNAFPLTWISNNINAYQAYIRNVIGLDFDNEEVLKKYVSDYLKTI